LKTSCAKLLAAKYKLGSVSKVINKYGNDLKGQDKQAFMKPYYKLNTLHPSPQHPSLPLTGGMEESRGGRKGF
jgi:Type II intron maturase